MDISVLEKVKFPNLNTLELIDNNIGNKKFDLIINLYKSKIKKI